MFLRDCVFPVSREEPEAQIIEACIDEMLVRLKEPVRVALPPKHWRSKGAADAVEKEARRREAAADAWEELCVAALAAEATQF